MKRSGRRYLYSLIFGLFLLCLALPEGRAQVTSINGTINSYSKVTSFPDLDQAVIADNGPGFAAGQKVLLIQMKGAELSVGGSIYGSRINSTIGDYGFYEFIVIDDVTGLTVTFKNDIKGSYDPDSFVQLVQLPQYTNASIDGLLSCDTWNEVTGTGGVLTFLVDNNVYLNSDIDVSGKGFDGGISDIIQGLSITAAGVDPDLLDFTEADNRAARKGRGIGSHVTPVTIFSYADYARGKGRFANGGGGGNGRFAGGGGGSSYGQGGQGGADLGGNFGAGYPGENPNTVWVTDRYNPVLMGGGGGAGGSGSGGTDVGSDGGRGGGIIIILADTIFGNGHSIISNGESVSTIAEDDGGAGGGGAAGAIVISASYKASSPLSITSNGGNGGHTYNFDGFGGGGSGGLIFTNKNLTSFSVLSTAEPGEEGATNYMGSNSGIPSGFAGQISDSLLIRLNGFLFNTIVSNNTKSRSDTICFGDSAPKLIGTDPTGGSGTYEIKWIRKKDTDVVWDTIPGETGKDLELTTPEDDTVSFKRVVFDKLQSPWVIDVSKETKIIVQPLITGNTIGFDTIICWNQDPDAILPIDILGGGTFDSADPDSAFTWMSSGVNNTDYHMWSVADNISNERSYDPPVLTDTIYYYRAVKSGYCYDTSNVVEIIVLPIISGNSIGDSQEVCEDSLFVPLEETGSLTGGDGSYVYEWQVFNGAKWVAAAGTVDQPGYDPNQLTYTYNQDTLLRRYIWSGASNVCYDSSNVDTLKMWSDILGNIILADQTTMAGDPVVLLTGDTYTGGDINQGEIFEWQDSTKIKDWSTAGGISDQETYQPPDLSDTTWYRRIITRGDCEDISNKVVINVNPAISNNIINLLSGDTDTTICNNQDIILFEGSLPAGGDEVTYVYKWEVSTDNVNFTDAEGVITNQDYDPPALTTPALTVTTYYFRRNVTSGASTGISNTITITVLPDIEGNTISGDQTVCSDTPIEVDITGAGTLAGGAGLGTYDFKWYQSSDNVDWTNEAGGVNTDEDYVPPADPTVPMYYRRHVTSPEPAGCCTSISNAIFVDIYDLPVGTITGISLAEACAGDDVTISLDMSAAGQAPYTVILADGIGEFLPEFTATTDIFDHTFTYTSSGDFTDYTFQFSTLTDANGCVAPNMISTANLRVYTVPTATISPATPDNVCGDNVVLEATPSVGSGLWSCPDADILSVTSVSTSATTNVTVDESATYTFTWEETNVICTNSTTKNITFWEQPDPVDAGLGETLLPLTTKYLLSATTPSAGSGLWTAEPDAGQAFFPDNNESSEVSGLVDGLNVLRWTVRNGDYCLEESDTIMLNVTMLIIPSGFSPNMDGTNDIFEVKGLDNLDVKAELIVTDMTGVVVYESPEYHNDWDGRNSISQEYLPDGTYYYFLRIKEPDQRQLKGFIIIKRSIGRD